jgi:hypothetical protein
MALMARLAAVDRATLQQPEAPEIRLATTVETAPVELGAAAAAALVRQVPRLRLLRGETEAPERLAMPVEAAAEDA